MDMVAIIGDHIGRIRVLEIIEKGDEMLEMRVVTWFVYRSRVMNDQLSLDWLPKNGRSGLKKGKFIKNVTFCLFLRLIN